jgi:hypothetical protein
MFRLKGEIERIITFSKKLRKVNKNQNNEDQIEKHYTINLN